MIKRNTIIRQIRPFMELDPYVNDKQQYEIRSVYFDSPFRRSFFEKKNGINVRIKLRTRYYPDFRNGDEELVFIELKKKINENVSKTRVLAPFKDAFKIIDNSTSEAQEFYNKSLKEDKNSLEEIWYLYKRFHLQPVCVVSYNRQPYMDKFENRFRITFDTDVRVRNYNFDLHDGSGNKYIIPPNICVLEIKFTSFIPKWAIGILHKNGVLQQKMSKFANGLERTRSFSII